MADSVLTETTDGLTTITLNRPKTMNALNTELKTGLHEALASAKQDENCRAILLTGGSARAFCVGQDLVEHVKNLAGDDPLATVREHYNPIATLLFNMDKPVACAVQGAAAGAGASLTFLCDFRVGGPSTKFTMAFSAIGLAADTGASYTLPRIVGQAKAHEMLMLNTTVGAQEAAQTGLLTHLTDTDDEVQDTARKLATQLAAGPTLAYAQIKQQLRLRADFNEMLSAEAAAQAACGFSSDHSNAVDAFVNKRKPRFEGK